MNRDSIRLIYYYIVIHLGTQSFFFHLEKKVNTKIDQHSTT